MADFELWGWFCFERKTYIRWHKKAVAVKKQMELAILSYVEYLAGVRVKGGERSRNVGKEILLFFSF